MSDSTPLLPEIPSEAFPADFRPAPGGRNPHVQTLAGKFMRPEPEVPFLRERWDTPDGDFLDVDILEPALEAEHGSNGAPARGADLGTGDHGRDRRVVLLHGLEGNSRRRYIRCAAEAMRQRGLGVLALNFRSCSGEPNLKARAYHSGETGDLGWVVDQAMERWPSTRLGALGFSLGGNVLLKYLAEQGEDSPLQAAVSISVPFDLGAGSTQLESSRMGRLYARYFLKSLVGKIRTKSELMPAEFDLARIATAGSLREFDGLVTAPLHGFRDAEHYYAESSSGPLLDQIRVPTLVLQSTDDPFLPASAVPTEALEQNPWLHPVLTPMGGHVGFLSRSLRRPELWAEQSAARYLDVVLRRA